MDTLNQCAAATAPDAGLAERNLQGERQIAQLQRSLEQTQQALAEATRENLQFKSLLNHLPAMVGYWDAERINRYANHAYLDWFGLEPSAVTGRHLRDVLGSKLYELNDAYVKAALAGQAQHFERVITNPQSGAQRVSLADYVPHTEAGEVRGFFVMVSDITAQKEAELTLVANEKVLRRSEDRYRNVVMDQTELISRLRADGSYVFVNEVFCRFFGKTEQELMGSTWAPLVHPEDKERVLRELSALSPEIPVVVIENRVIGGAGQTCWMQFSNRGFFNADGALVEIQSVGRDICARKEAEAQLHRANAALTASQRLLRAMAARNEARIESERKHFSREVHDELGQILTALRMDMMVLELKFCNENPELSTKVHEMKYLLDQAFQGVRNVAANLRPAALDMGLAEALHWLCEEFARKSGVACEFLSHIAELPNEKAATVLFRIVQESLTNISRHAQASRVDVTLHSTDAALHVAVQDNGLGFDPNLRVATHHYGLLGMQERALTLGGEVQVHSAPGQGTRIAVTIPHAQAYRAAAPP
jgi:PAS domain S-box-containing protein